MRSIQKILLITIIILSVQSVAAQIEISTNVVIDNPTTTYPNADGYIIKSNGSITINNGGSLTVTHDLTNEGGLITINNGGILKVYGTLTNTNGEKLIIEEGGQLVYIGDNSVQATVKKTISAFDEDKQVGWYTISTPITDKFITVSNFCAGNVDNYDLYCFLAEGPVWIESQDGDDLFMYDLGLGYLYANLESDNYCFNGIVNTAAYTNNVPLAYNESDLNGFNLLGNPYPHNIYMGQYYDAELNAYISCGVYNENIIPYYYTIENGGWWWPHEYTDAIKPCQGFLIKSLNASIDKVSILNKHHTPEKYPPYTDDNSNKTVESKLIMTVLGDSGKDKIIVNFSNGIGLDKIDHISEKAPYLCVNYDNQNYSIAHVGSNCNTLDVIFRNNQTGFFTLNVEEGLSDFSYLHLIDNITGDDIDLLLEPSYKFAANGNEYESRFKLVFTPNANDGIDNTTFAYISNNDIIISGVKEKATLQVYDITGRMIKSEIVSGVEGSISRVAKPNVTGVYVLRLIESNNVNTQKIVVE